MYLAYTKEVLTDAKSKPVNPFDKAFVNQKQSGYKNIINITSLVAHLKTQSVLELLNNFSNLSTVAYKGVAYKKSCKA